MVFFILVRFQTFLIKNPTDHFFFLAKIQIVDKKIGFQ